MDNDHILTAAQLDGYTPRKDGSFTLRFATQEKSPEDVANFARAYNKFGYLHFKTESELTPEEIKMLGELKIEFYDTPKTKSDRLRNALHQVWKKVSNKGHEEFGSFYEYEMERIIQFYKDKLPPV